MEVAPKIERSDYSFGLDLLHIVEVVFLRTRLVSAGTRIADLYAVNLLAFEFEIRFIYLSSPP